jgi:hypothetical protein
MAKKLIKRFIIEVFEIDLPIEIDKNEVKENLAKVVKENTITAGGLVISREKLKALADKREKELQDYYSPDYKAETQNNKQ